MQYWQDKYRLLCCTKYTYDLVAYVVGLLQSLNMNNAEFAFSQLQEHKLCVTSETHFDVVVLVVRVVFVCLVVWYYETSHAISQKFELYAWPLRYDT